MKVKVKSRGDKRDLLIEVRSDAGEQIDYADIDRLQRAGDALIAPDAERRGDAWALCYTAPGYVCLRSSAERIIGRPQLERALRSVLAACRVCESERLARRRVLFDPQWVAFSPSSGKMRFVYVPLAAVWAPFEVNELLIWLASHLEAADSAAWELMERTLSYARLARVLACVDFEAFLIGCGVMPSAGATGALGAAADDDRPRPVEAPAPRGFDFVRLASQVGADAAGRDAGSARPVPSARSLSGAVQTTATAAGSGADRGAPDMRKAAGAHAAGFTAPVAHKAGAARPSFASAPGSAVSSVLSAVIRRVSTGERWRLACGQYRMGRDEDCEIPVSGNSSISRHHALVAVSPAGMTVRDERSANGTYVEGARITAGVAVPVRPGSWFALSNERFEVES